MTPAVAGLFLGVMNLTLLQKNIVEQVNNLAALAALTPVFEAERVRNAAHGDVVVIFSRGALRTGRVIKATADNITVAYVTPGGVEDARKSCERCAGWKPEADGSDANRIALARGGHWQLWVTVTEKRVPRSHLGTPELHHGFNCI